MTWCSGAAPIAAGRRWSLSGALGGRIEVDSVWIHLGPDERPARLDEFGLYAEAAGDREVSTKLRLPKPAGGRGASSVGRARDRCRPARARQQLVHWQAGVERLVRRGPDPREPLRAFLDYRQPIDLDDDVSLVEWGEADVQLALVTTDAVKAVALVESSTQGAPLDR